MKTINTLIFHRASTTLDSPLSSLLYKTPHHAPSSLTRFAPLTNYVADTNGKLCLPLSPLLDAFPAVRIRCGLTFGKVGVDFGGVKLSVSDS